MVVVGMGGGLWIKLPKIKRMQWMYWFYLGQAMLWVCQHTLEPKELWGLASSWALVFLLQIPRVQQGILYGDISPWRKRTIGFIFVPKHCLIGKKMRSERNINVCLTLTCNGWSPPLGHVCMVMEAKWLSAFMRGPQSIVSHVIRLSTAHAMTILSW